MNRPRIAVAICTHPPNTERRRACRETWIAGLPADVAYFFYSGADTGEPDVVTLGTSDEYHELTTKHAAMLRYAAGLGADHVFRCDDDTYVAGDRLHSLTAGDPVTGHVLADKQQCSGGAGYLFPGDRCAEIAEAMNPDCPWDDVAFTQAVRRLGMTVRHTGRLCPSRTLFPERDNDVVSAHYCTLAHMRLIRAGLAGRTGAGVP